MALIAWGKQSHARFASPGPPTNVTPDNVGDLCVDYVTPALYQANGVTKGAWVAVAGGGVTLPSQVGNQGRFLYATDQSAGLGWAHPLDMIDAATEFGVVGNLSTDCTTQLQAAIDAAPYSVPGLSGNDVPARTVILPPGYIVVQNGALGLVPNVTIQGQGRSSTYLDPTGTGGPTLSLKNGSEVQVTLRDFAITNNHPTDCINLNQTSNPGSVTDTDHLIENMVIVGGTRAIFLAGGTECRVSNVIATRNSPGANQGAFHFTCTDMMVYNCTASAIQSANGTACSAFFLACANSRIENCKAFGPSGASGFTAGFWLSGLRSQIIGCEVQDFPGSGFVIFASDWTVLGCVTDSVDVNGLQIAGTFPGGCVVKGFRVIASRGGGAYSTDTVLQLSESQNNVIEIMATASPTRFLQNGASGFDNALTFNNEKGVAASSAFATPLAPDPLAAGVYPMTLTGNLTINAPSPGITNGVHVGMQLVFQFTQDGTGGRTLTLNAAYKTNHSDTGNTAGKTCTITVVYNGTSWVGTSTGWL